MIVFGRLWRNLRAHVRKVSWGVVAAALLLHMAGTFVLMTLAGEAKLVAPDAFLYFYMTTATTIGYGDLTPGSTLGRHLVALFVMPGGIALFASVLGKTSATLLAFWKRHQMGTMNYDDMRGHTVLVGWRGRDSQRLVKLLLADCSTDDEGIVLVAEGLAENPVPDAIRFVAIDTYTNSADYLRAGIAGAARVIVHAPNDDQTLAATLAVMAHKPRAHVVAHFDAEGAARLVRQHHPRVECTRPLYIDVIARAAQDAGSSLVADEWLATGGVTQFSLRVPSGAPPLLAGKVGDAFRAHGALWIGYRDANADAPTLLADDATRIAPGALLYYLARQRIDDARLPWTTLSA